MVKILLFQTLQGLSNNPTVRFTYTDYEAIEVEKEIDSDTFEYDTEYIPYEIEFEIDYETLMDYIYVIRNVGKCRISDLITANHLTNIKLFKEIQSGVFVRGEDYFSIVREISRLYVEFMADNN